MPPKKNTGRQKGKKGHTFYTHIDAYTWAEPPWVRTETSPGSWQHGHYTVARDSVPPSGSGIAPSPRRKQGKIHPGMIRNRLGKRAEI